MNPGVQDLEVSQISIPRVSGDEPTVVNVIQVGDVYSPRERG